MNIKWLAAATLLALAVGVLGTRGAVTADEKPSFQMTVSPAKIDISLKAGETQADKFEIINSGAESFDYVVTVTPYRVNADYSADLNGDSNYTLLKDWITFDGEKTLTGTLEAGEQRVVEFIIEVPEDLPGGGQYAALVIRATDKSGSGGGIATDKQIGILVYGRNAKDADECGELIKRSIGFWFMDGVVDTSYKVKNCGNVHIEVGGNLIVTSLFGGKKKYESEVVERLVLPETERDIALKWEDVPIGLYKLTQRVMVMGEWQEKTKMILVMPLYVMILGLLGVAALAYLVWRTIVGKKKTKRKIRR